ncbi:hypothetical protein C8R46DRAFT_1189770 [Mycena filopes]|nr:hypothetical protein C8R46DRAFT_1189770 [Mycena filopes]
MPSARSLSAQPNPRAPDQFPELLAEIQTLQATFTELTGADSWGRLLAKVDSYTAPHVRVHPWVVSYRTTTEQEDLFSFLTDIEKLSTGSLAEAAAAGTRARKQDLPEGDARLAQHAWAAAFVAGEHIAETQERHCAEVRYYDPNTSEADVPNPGAHFFGRIRHRGWLQQFHRKNMTKWWRWCNPDFQKTTDNNCNKLTALWVVQNAQSDFDRHGVGSDNWALVPGTPNKEAKEAHENERKAKNWRGGRNPNPKGGRHK